MITPADGSIGGLFEGYGGLTAGVRSVLGGDLAWYSEIDPAASRVLAHHHPGVPNLGDITAVDWTAVEPVDVLTGGFPCQDVSAAGKRAGMRPDEVIPAGVMDCGCQWANHDVETCEMAIRGYVPSRLWARGKKRLAEAAVRTQNIADYLKEPYPPERTVKGTRSGLWSHMRYAISQLRPRLVVVENVRGLLSAEAHCDVERCPWCLGDERDVVLRALGAVLADLAELGYDAVWCGLRASDVGAPHQRFRVFIVAADTTGKRHGDTRTSRVGGVPAAAVASAQRAVAADATGNGRHEGWSEPTRVERGPDAAIGGGIAWGDFTPAIRRWEGILGRLAPAPTVVGARSPRVLNPAFVEFMMGLPAGHVTGVEGLSRNDQLKILGNGVVPQQAAAAVRYLLPLLLPRATPLKDAA